MAASIEAKSVSIPIITEILSLLQGKNIYEAANSHLNEIRSVPHRAEKEKAESYLRWARHKTNLKVIQADVPVGVLPDGLVGELYDVKVFCRRGPDDSIYDNNKDIRDRVARGNCFLNIGSGSQDGIRCVLQALKKFTGGLGDDDDRETGDNFTWQRYFTKRLEDTEVVIATRKANGEAAHLSCFMIGGEFILCGGSKNVHMVFRKKSDIQRYAEPRFRIAREICETVMDILDQMKPDQKERLLRFLAFSRYTAIFEILSPLHQHVEDLSYLTTPELRFITWTKVELEPSEDNSLGVIPPHVGIEIARALGLQTIDYDILPMSDLEQRMKQIRQGYQYEGEVLYFLDDSGSVIGLLKKKTVWYIMCRAIREKLRGTCKIAEKNPDSYSISQTLRKVDKRIDEIQVWLGLDGKTVQVWKELGVKFIRWTMSGFDKGNITLDDVCDKFPVLWSRFLKENGETDKFTDISCSESASSDR